MARDFNGTNERLSFGTDASVDGFTTLTVAFYVAVDTANTRWLIGKGSGFWAAWSVVLTSATFPMIINLLSAWSGANARWSQVTGSVATAGVVYQLVITYDNTSTTNDPVFYLNGAVVAQTELTAPSGSVTSDAGETLAAGENTAGGNDFDGRFQHLIYDSRAWDAGQVNRHRWWGRPDGATAVNHPLLTSKLANEGTATADGTATGTTMASMATPVQRPGSVLMGLGVGW